MKDAEKILMFHFDKSFWIVYKNKYRFLQWCAEAWWCLEPNFWILMQAWSQLLNFEGPTFWLDAHHSCLTILTFFYWMPSSNMDALSHHTVPPLPPLSCITEFSCISLNILLHISVLCTYITVTWSNSARLPFDLSTMHRNTIYWDKSHTKLSGSLNEPSNTANTSTNLGILV